MSQFVELPTAQLFQMSVISSRGSTNRLSFVCGHWIDKTGCSPWYIALIKASSSMIYDARTFLFHTNTAPHHNKTQYLIRIFTLLTFWLVVLLLSAQVSEKNIRVTLSETTYNYFFGRCSQISKRDLSFFFEGTGFLLRSQEQLLIDRVRLKSCNNATSPNTNLICSGLESKPGLRDERHAIKRLNRWHSLDICSLSNQNELI